MSFEDHGGYGPSAPVGFGPPPRAEHAHPHWVCVCGEYHSPTEHLCRKCGKRHDYGDVIKNIAMEKQMNLPQYVLDTMENDGPISVAYQFQPHVIGIRPERPSPATGQYPYRYDAKALENWGKIRSHEEIEGYVQASVDADAGSGISEDDLKRLHLDKREDSIVYMVVSGWALMMWRTKEDYNRGVNGARNAPRPLGWWDLRKAFDVHVEQGTDVKWRPWMRDEVERCPHRLAVLTNEGVVYFRVAFTEDVYIWYNGIRGLIRDYHYNFIKFRDTKHHQQKRWPCAIGLAEHLQRGLPIGERAMASAFHCYDLDYNCILGIGEIMVMIQEIEAGIRHNSGLAEARGRDEAVESGISMFEGGLNEVFEMAMKFRNACDKDGNGQVRVDEFMAYGQALLCDAMGFQPSGGHLSDAGDACVIA
jgi:hypothetical protein